MNRMVKTATKQTTKERPEDLDTVGHERLEGRKRAQLLGRREATHRDLGTLEANWAIP